MTLSLFVRSVDFRSFADDRSAADHMNLTESYNTINSTGGSEDDSASTRLLSWMYHTDGHEWIAWDPFHINSITKDAEGDYLVSSRYASSLLHY